MSYEYYDYDEIKERLLESSNLEYVLHDIFPGNSPVKKGNEWRYGDRKNPHLAIQVSGQQKGIWYDHVEKEGGFIVSLIAREMGCSSGDAWEYAGSKLGVIKRTFESKSKYDEFKKKAEQERAEIQREQREIAKKEALEKQDEALKRVSEIIDNSVPIKGTLAEEYLLKTRGLEKVFPDNYSWENDFLRFKSSVYHAESNAKYPALIAIARDKSGTAWAAQVTFLDPTTNNKVKFYIEDPDTGEKSLAPAKKTYGTLKKVNPQGESEPAHCYCVLKKGRGAILASEGIENACSFYSVDNDHELRAVFGLSNFENCIDYQDAKDLREVVYIEDQDADLSKVETICDYFRKYPSLSENVENIYSHLSLLKKKNFRDFSNNLLAEIDSISAVWKGSLNKSFSEDENNTFRKHISKLRAIRSVNNIKANALEKFCDYNITTSIVQPSCKAGQSMDFNDILLDPVQGREAVESYYHNRPHVFESQLRKAPLISTKEKLDSVKGMLDKANMHTDKVLEFKAYREQLIGIKQLIKKEGNITSLATTKKTLNEGLISTCQEIIDNYDGYKTRLAEQGLTLEDVQKWSPNNRTASKAPLSQNTKEEHPPAKASTAKKNSVTQTNHNMTVNERNTFSKPTAPSSSEGTNVRPAPRLVLRKKEEASSPRASQELEEFKKEINALRHENAELHQSMAKLSDRLSESISKHSALEEKYNELYEDLRSLHHFVHTKQHIADELNKGSVSSNSVLETTQESIQSSLESPEKPKFGTESNEKDQKQNKSKGDQKIDELLNQISGYTRNKWTSRGR